MDSSQFVGVVILALIAIAVFYLARTDARNAQRRLDEAKPLVIQPDAPKPATIVRTYRGRNQEDAVAVMRPDVEWLAGQGYVVSAQSWAPGAYGCGAFLVALLLFIILVGILVFIYMIFVKPDGTLTVTYTLRDQPVATAAVTGPPDAMASLEALGKLRDTGVLTPEEFEAKKAEILGRV